MNIGIEATSATEIQKAGVGYYTYHLLRAIVGLQRREHRYTFYVRAASPEIFPAREEQHSTCRVKVLHMPYCWAQARLPLELWRHPQDVYFFPSPVIPLIYQPSQSVVTVHDVAFLFFQECFAPLLRYWLRIATRLGVNRAKKIIAVSESTRQDVIAYYRVPPDKVVTVHHGISSQFHAADSETITRMKTRYHLDEKYILCIGTLQRRKNIPRLLEAFHRLKTTRHIPHKFVLIGRKYSELPEQEIFAAIERLSLQHEVIWTGYVEQHELPALLSGAEMFVFPSLYEGFGMSLLEAMACGVPVACSNTSSLPEVVGDCGVLFDPYNIEDIATGMWTLIADKNLRLELAEKGLRRVQHFSWERCAQQTLDVLESVHYATA